MQVKIGTVHNTCKGKQTKRQSDTVLCISWYNFSESK